MPALPAYNDCNWETMVTLNSLRVVHYHTLLLLAQLGEKWLQLEHFMAVVSFFLLLFFCGEMSKKNASVPLPFACLLYDMQSRFFPRASSD